jgi:hypothetical protein
MRPALLGAILLLGPGVARAAEPCGGLTLADGRAKTGVLLLPTGRETEACLKVIGRALAERPAVRAITVAARVPDEDRAAGNALNAAMRAAEQLVEAGIPPDRVSAVAPRTEKDEAPNLQVFFVDAPVRWAAGVLRVAQGEVLSGRSEKELKKQSSRGELQAQETLYTRSKSRAELLLAEGSFLRVRSEAAVKLASVQVGSARKVNLELSSGGLEVEVAPGTQFEVRTPNALVRVKGTQARVAYTAGKATRVEALEGSAVLEGSGGKIELARGQAASLQGDAPEGKRAMLEAPRILGPAVGKFKISPALRWAEVKGAATYRLELAREVDFVDGFEILETPSTGITPPALGPGRWYWRVVATDGDGFSGLPSKIHAFERLR